ncbi:hypothetical protein ACS5PK_12570 [Roseateles sp. DB2]|uniref:hypothetical protein n=1 Tax=Roseateles sp. DB2 TaxID=3453717 RepID=UPI003EEF60CA
MNPSTTHDSEPNVAEQAGDALRRAGAHGSDALRHAAASASHLTQQGVRQGRGLANAWHAGACEHIRSHPMRSVALAAGSGAAVALLLRVLSR